MELLTVLGLCWIGQSNSRDDGTCNLADCHIKSCPKISKTECEEIHRGLFVAKADRCGCCDVCVPFHHVEESCERSVIRSPFTSVAGDSVTTCGPGLVYRGDVEACDKPRNGEESDFETLAVNVTKARTVKRNVAPPRSHQIRWSACQEPKCDRGVCPPGSSRQSNCGGRFYPNTHCPCCGQCSRPFLDDIDSVFKIADYDKVIARQTPRSGDTDSLTCHSKGAQCYQYGKCFANETYRASVDNSCYGWYESRDAKNCHCCGTCRPYSLLYQECADSKDGNKVERFPGCKPGLDCVKSPIDDKYICFEPCPNAADCYYFKCPKDLIREYDCPKEEGVFKVATFCACCGRCQYFLNRGDACFVNAKPVEPGCGLALECKNGKCVQLRRYKSGAAEKAQDIMLDKNPLAWTSFEYPQSDREGYYYPVQCKAYKCYCVAPDGSPLGYIMPRFYAFNMLCDCAREKYYGKSFLRCDHLGNYQNLDFAGIPIDKKKTPP